MTDMEYLLIGRCIEAAAETTGGHKFVCALDRTHGTLFLSHQVGGTSLDLPLDYQSPEAAADLVRDVLGRPSGENVEGGA